MKREPDWDPDYPPQGSKPHHWLGFVIFLLVVWLLSKIPSPLL